MEKFIPLTKGQLKKYKELTKFGAETLHSSTKISSSVSTFHISGNQPNPITIDPAVVQISIMSLKEEVDKIGFYKLGSNGLDLYAVKSLNKGNDNLIIASKSSVSTDTYVYVLFEDATGNDDIECDIELLELTNCPQQLVNIHFGDLVHELFEEVDFEYDEPFTATKHEQVTIYHNLDRELKTVKYVNDNYSMTIFHYFKLEDNPSNAICFEMPFDFQGRLLIN